METWQWAALAGALVGGGVIGFVLARLTGQAAVNAERPLPVALKKPSGAPLRLLAVLQREGRLLDFLLEDITAYDDAQVGAAVRDIHRGCRQALQEHVTLERILPGEEEQEVTVPAGFDASAVRLTGNVTGEPPFRGVLRHHGWRVKQMKLAEPPAGQDEFVVAPAEVNMQ